MTAFMHHARLVRLRASSLRIIVVCLPVIAILGCGAVRMEKDAWRAELDTSGQEALRDAGEESGGPVALRDPLRGGAVLVYRIHRERDGGIQTWWMTVEGPHSADARSGTTTSRITAEHQGERTTAAFLSPAYPGRLAIVDPAGSETASGIELHLGFLSEGFAHVCEAGSSMEGGGPAGELWLDAAMRSMACSISLSTLGTGNKAARALLRELIQMPSLWKWLVPALDGNIAIDPPAAERTSTELGPGWIVPAEFRLKGDPAFYAKLVVVPPRGALRMTGGILSGVGFAPNRPHEKVRWSLDRAYFEGSETGGESIPSWSKRLD